MADEGDLREQPPPAVALRRYLNQTMIPAAIDSLAYGEVAASRVATWARKTPITALALALGCGIILAAVLKHGRKQR